VGAVSGALPPVTGWVAASDGLGPGAGALFAIVFLWQLPHTLAIAWLHRDDYARAGIRFLPVIDGDGAWTGRGIVASSVALLGASLLPALLGLTGGVYLAGAITAGAAVVAVAAGHARAPSARRARWVLLASLLYLPLLLGLLALDRG